MMEESSDESAEIITKEEADLARKMQDADISRKYQRVLNGGNVRMYITNMKQNHIVTITFVYSDFRLCMGTNNNKLKKYFFKDF